jgi:hypothetical protein
VASVAGVGYWVRSVLDEQQGLVRNRLRGLETQKQKNPQARTPQDLLSV